MGDYELCKGETVKALIDLILKLIKLCHVSMKSSLILPKMYYDIIKTLSIEVSFSSHSIETYPPINFFPPSADTFRD